MAINRTGVVLVLTCCLISAVATASGQSLHFPFDNQEQHARAVSTPSLEIEGGMTVEAWLRADSGIDSEFLNFIVSKNNEGTGYALLTEGAGTNKRWVFEIGSSRVDALIGPLMEEWVHVAGVWSGGVARLYVNGDLEAEATAGPPVASAVDLWVGSSPFGRSLNWQGSLAEVRIWDTARTQQEIEDTMVRSITGAATGLVANWRFTEDSGTIASDSSGQGNDLELRNVYRSYDSPLSDYCLEPSYGCFGKPRRIDDLSGSVASSSNDDLGIEPGEPNHGGPTGPHHSQWYRLVAVTDATVTLDTTGSSYDTVLAAYTGRSIDRLTRLESSDDYPGYGVSSRIDFEVEAGRAYAVAVDGATPDSTGSTVLSWTLAPQPPTAGSDSFAGAPAISPTVEIDTSNVGATREPSEPQHADTDTGASLWWTFVVPEDHDSIDDDSYRFSTEGSGIDTVLAIYQGDEVSNLTEVRSNDDCANGLDLNDASGNVTLERGSCATLPYDVQPGAVYRVAVSGYQNTTGPIHLQVTRSELGIGILSFFSERPEIVDARAVSSTEVEVTWTDRSIQETDYVVLAQQLPSGKQQVVAELPANATFASIGSLLPATAYEFQVAAYIVTSLGRGFAYSTPLTETTHGGGQSCQLGCGASASIDVGDVPLHVDFSAALTPTGDCTGNVSYEWHFGDGSSSPDASPSHTYYQPGTYDWLMVASDGDATCSDIGTVVVSGSLTELYLIGVAHVAGLNNTQWRSSVEFCNLSDDLTEFEVDALVRAQSNPDPESRVVILEGDQCARLDDALQVLFGLEGAVTLRFGTLGNVIIAGRNYNQSAEGTYGSFKLAAAEDQTVTFGKVGRLVHLAQSSNPATGFRTNLSVVNLTATETDVEVDVYATGGSTGPILLGTLPFRLGPYEYRQTNRMITYLTPDDVPTAFAEVRITTPGGRVLTGGSLVDNGTGDGSAIPPVVLPGG